MALFPVKILVVVSFSQALFAKQCINGDIRLARNSTLFEGGIDVCVGTVWGTVCNDFWGPNEVRVACRQLGYQVSGRESFIDLIIEGGPEILIDNINCTGGEQNLTECIFDPDASDCLGNFTHRVGVRCHEERPPQNVDVIASGVDLNVTWEEPFSGVTNEPVLGYNIECSTSTMPDSNIQYKASAVVQTTTTSIVIPFLENPRSNLPIVYNCCVEAEYEAYSSISCASKRSAQVPTTTSSEISTISVQLSTASTTSSTLGGVLGAIILILTLLLVLSLAGLLYMYRRVKIAEEDRDNTDGAPSYNNYNISESDAPERIVENPTYGENDAPPQNTYEGVEQYSRTGPDYEPIVRDPNAEQHYTSLEESTVPHIEYASDTD